MRQREVRTVVMYVVRLTSALAYALPPGRVRQVLVDGRPTTTREQCAAWANGEVVRQWRPGLLDRVVHRLGR